MPACAVQLYSGALCLQLRYGMLTDVCRQHVSSYLFVEHSKVICDVAGMTWMIIPASASQ